jgi:hypothetical protein
MMVFSQASNVNKQSCVNRERCYGGKKAAMDLYGKNYFDHLESFGAKVADPLFWRPTFAAMPRISVLVL